MTDETTVKFRFPGDMTVTRIDDPDLVEVTDTWVKVTTTDRDGETRVIQLNQSVPCMVETVPEAVDG